MSTIIKVENLSKKYQIYHESQSVSDTLKEALAKKGANFFKQLFKSNKNQSKASSYEEFWALRDLNFDIRQGDRVGIIGRNGAGKSTLLKILSRITEPTAGRVEIRGRMASLLEVGTGFHPDLTGRENIFLNGAILGMSRKEIKRQFDSIVAFAEIEKFLDTPVKRFSSGMYTRLGFAIAAHLDTDLLIVDEVLAVGDAQFQEKCLKKMNELGECGRTILFVSHNIGSVLTLCNKGIFLEKGKVKAFGDVNECVREYSASCPKASTAWQGAVGNEFIQILSAAIVGSSKEYFHQGEKVNLLVEYDLLKPHKDLSLTVGIWNSKHQLLGQSRLNDTEEGAFASSGRHKASFNLDAGLFHDGEYLIKVDCSLYNKKSLTNDEISLKFPVYAKHEKLMVPRGTKEGISLGNKWSLERM